MQLTDRKLGAKVGKPVTVSIARLLKSRPELLKTVNK